MKFLAVVIALMIFKVGAGRAVQQDAWFERWRRQVAGWQLAPWPGLGLLILVPTLIAVGVLDTVNDLLLGLPWIPVAVVLMLYALGRSDLEQLQSRYRMQCRSGAFEAGIRGVLPADIEQVPALAAPEAHHLVQRELIYEAYQRWFAVVFYFIVAGPAAALVYRLVHLSRGPLEAPPVTRVLVVLDWVPARLLAATFAVAGDFVRCRAVLAKGVMDPGKAADELLYEVGCLASGARLDDAFSVEQASAEHEEAGDLIARSGVVWVVVLALLVLLD